VSILGVTVNATALSTAQEFAHAITWGVTLALLTNITQFVYHKSKKRPLPHLHRWGPFYCCLLSIPFVMADLSRHVLMDYHYISLPMYNSNPNCTSSTMRCLSAYGWLFTVLFTYSGYTLLITGVLWAADICAKIRVAVRKARARSK